MIHNISHTFTQRTLFRRRHGSTDIETDRQSAAAAVAAEGEARGGQGNGESLEEASHHCIPFKLTMSNHLCPYDRLASSHSH